MQTLAHENSKNEIRQKQMKKVRRVNIKISTAGRKEDVPRE